jgi:DNA ligase 1
MNDSVAAGTEGLIVKSLDSTYEPSRRSVNWLKLKKDYMDSVGDTFDVVPIGAWFGK